MKIILPLFLMILCPLIGLADKNGAFFKRLNVMSDREYADPSAPNLEDPRFIRVFMTGGEVLTWRRDLTSKQSIAEILMSQEPQHERLRFCHHDGRPFNTENEDVWDPSLRDGVLYGGVMTVQKGQSFAQWPEDNWSRRTYAFIKKEKCWTMQAKPLWGEKPVSVSWIDHNYGHDFVSDRNGVTYVFYERVTDDSFGQPWKTEIFARRMVNALKASDEEISILKIPQKPWPRARRYSGGTLLEGPRVMRIHGKYLIAFSAGEYTSDRYGIHLASADYLEGPYKPYLNNNGKDLQDFGREIEKVEPMTWGPGRAVFFADANQVWTFFHGIPKREVQETGDNLLRNLYLAPVTITPQSGGSPVVRIGFSR